MFAEPCAQSVKRHRPCNAVPLDMQAAKLSNHSVLANSLDAFCQRFKVKLFGHRHDRSHQGLLGRVTINASEVASVDIQFSLVDIFSDTVDGSARFGASPKGCQCPFKHHFAKADQQTLAL